MQITKRLEELTKEFDTLNEDIKNLQKNVNELNRTIQSKRERQIQIQWAYAELEALNKKTDKKEKKE